MFGRFGRRQPQSSSTALADDKPGAAVSAHDLVELLAAIETTAGTVYGRHGLPQRPGHYRRRADGGAWEALGDTLSPAEKWALIEADADGGRWRYCAYEGLGAHSDIPAVRQASAILAACQGLRQRLADRATISAQDLADSIRLGEAWRRLAENASFGEPGAAALHFLPPDES